MTDVRDPTDESTTTRHAAVQRFFGTHRKAWLDRYDSDTFDARNYRCRAEVALAFLQDFSREPGRLLEVGCGAGVQAAAAAAIGWNVSATDITLPLLAQAKEAFAGPMWVAASAERLPFQPGSFDVVLMLGVIGYVDDPLVVLRHVQTMLRPGGAIIISWARKDTLLESVSRAVSAVPDRVYLGAKQILRRVPPRPFKGLSEGVPDDTTPRTDSFYTAYNRFWDRTEFVDLLADAGFAVRHARGVNFGQFRFMDRSLWPERTDAWISSALERASVFPGFQMLGRYTRTHIAVAEKIV